jgi:redox-sensitive bicupin YhaK (pirin superfamily)
MKSRQIKSVIESTSTMEGAGVRLHRGFANEKAHLFDPFLLFDDFRAAKAEDFIKGFPWHPHRGIETIHMFLEVMLSMEIAWATKVSLRAEMYNG